MDRHAFVARADPADAPAMPAGTRVRYLSPAPAIAAAITGYNLYGAAMPDERVAPFLPGMAMLTFLVDASPVQVRTGNLVVSPLPQVALYGALTRPLWGTTRGGVMIGVGISPIGWARLFSRSAADLRNRVVPLGDALGHGWGEKVSERLAAATDDAQVGEVLDAALFPLLRTPHPQEPLIAAFGAIIAADGDPDIVTVAARLGITTVTLRRVSMRFFGLSPKVLLRRARFLRSFLRDSGLDGSVGGGIDPSYFDRSHYLRDAHAFLGMSPTRFMALPIDFLRGSAAARALTLQAAHQALHHVPVPDPTA